MERKEKHSSLGLEGSSKVGKKISTWMKKLPVWRGKKNSNKIEILENKYKFWNDLSKTENTVERKTNWKDQKKKSEMEDKAKRILKQ